MQPYRTQVRPALGLLSTEAPRVCAGRLRAAHDAPSKNLARQQLARAVRALCVETICKKGFRRDFAEEAAQDIVCAVLARIEAGDVQPGREDGYVARAAHNRACDLFADQSGVRPIPTEEGELRSCAEALDSFAETPEDILLAVETETERQVARENLRDTIHRAPARYRGPLEHVLEGRTIQELVDVEIAVRGVDPADRPAARRARASVDKLLQRCRDWVRAHLGATK